MADKYRIHPFERAVLTVNKEKRKGKKERRGPLSKPRVDEIGRRRLKDDKLYARFYDFGQRANDADLGRIAPGTTTDWLLFVVDPATVFYTTAFGDSTDYNDIIFADAYTDFPSIYKEITQTFTDYQITIGAVGSYVAGKGLEIPPATSQIPVTSTGVFLRTLTLGATPGNFKYTATPVYSDPSVTLTLDKSIDVFLMPDFVVVGGEAVSEQGSPTYPHLPQTMHAVEVYLTSLPRTQTLNADWKNAWLNGFAVNHGNITQGQKDLLRETFINPYSIFEVDLNTAPVYAIPAGDITTLSGTDFPSVLAGSYETNPFIQISKPQTQLGTCLAVVRKRITPSTYEWYFLWNTTTFTQSPAVPFISGLVI